ncbi:hypothetical protein BRD01_02180 [Halobacteriales archaeon QS_8_65_32]|nr:MAG: hypothetical protein BRD01_02180 [Halobacteriales archaeon QS_8_65_32]
MAEDGARLYEQARQKDTDLDRAWEEICSINDRVEWDYENILSNRDEESNVSFDTESDLHSSHGRHERLEESETRAEEFHRLLERRAREFEPKAKRRARRVDE